MLDYQVWLFMPHIVTITPYTGKDNYGEDVASGTARTARAYVEPNVTLDQTTQTREEHRPLTAYIADTAITIRDRITLPDGTTPKITNVVVHTEVPGLDHTQVTFQ